MYRFYPLGYGYINIEDMFIVKTAENKEGILVKEIINSEKVYTLMEKYKVTRENILKAIETFCLSGIRLDHIKYSGSPLCNNIMTGRFLDFYNDVGLLNTKYKSREAYPEDTLTFFTSAIKLENKSHNDIIRMINSKTDYKFIITNSVIINYLSQVAILYFDDILTDKDELKDDLVSCGMITKIIGEMYRRGIYKYSYRGTYTDFVNLNKVPLNIANNLKYNKVCNSEVSEDEVRKMLFLIALNDAQEKKLKRVVSLEGKEDILMDCTKIFETMVTYLGSNIGGN